MAAADFMPGQQMGLPGLEPPAPVRRKRSRRIRIADMDWVERAKRFHDDDEAGRTQEMFNRLQRYAKYRQWTAGDVVSPWPDAADTALPDLFTQSQRVIDTLHNAVLSARPILQSKASDLKDKDKQRIVDELTDYQLLVENDQEWISDLLDAFVLDGHFTLFLPWVRDQRAVSMTYVAPPIPEVNPETGEPVLPQDYFRQLIQQKFPDAEGFLAKGSDPEDAWDFEVLTPAGEVDVSFYTGDGNQIEMVVQQSKVVFDGPKPLVKDRADVLHPPHAANLQAPGPSNPGGAPHVILVDRPTVDEVERLWKQGKYDKLGKDDIDAMKATDKLEGESKEQSQKATIEGAQDEQITETPDAQRRVTRLMVFDVVSLKKGQPAEDVVYTVFKEHEKLARFRRLNEDFPSTLGRRPFAERSFIPVRGRRIGIGMLEIIEGLHDAKKTIVDMSINHGQLLLSPFFFYRPSSSMKPETIRIFPGEGYPISDPGQDVNFPVIPSQGQAFAVNMYTLLDREQEKPTMIGDFQLGRVPHGKSSALRTAQGMAMVAAQGEERPERILRRLFSGLAQIWSMTHDLDRHFLTQAKRLRVAFPIDPSEDPYRTVERSAIDTTVEFEFNANAFNVSRSALQEALANIGAVILNPLSFQAGTVTADKLYAYQRELVRSWGQDPDKFLEPPSGEVRVTVKEAIAKIMDGQLPIGVPHEAPLRHLQGLQRFAASDLIGYLNDMQVQLFKSWLQYVQQEAMLQMQFQARAAGQAGPAGGEQAQGQGGGGETSEEAPVQENEIVDETLPTAGGGANTGPR